MIKAQIENGVVVNLIEVDPQRIPAWAATWVTPPAGIHIGFTYSGGVFAPPIPPSPTPDQVDAERDRRLAGTMTFMGVEYDVDQKSLARITGAATLAGFALAAGAQPGNFLWHGGSEAFTWITADNTLVQLDAQMTLNLGKTAAANETLHIFAARALKDMSPIPADYTADAYWP